VAIGSIVVLALAVSAHARAQVWRDPLTLWTDALQKAPEHPRPHVNLGMAVAAGGDFDRAIALYQRAAELDPSFQEAHHNRAVALQQLGRHEEAIVHFREALRLRPRDQVAHEAIALSLLAHGDWAGAGKHLERAARIGSEARVYFELARLRAADDRLDEALDLLRVALAKAPDHPPVLAELGVTLARQGRLDVAAQHVDRSLALRDDASVRVLRARIDWAAGRWAAAIDQADQARALAPESDMARATLSWMLLASPDAELRDFGRALAVIRQGSGASQHPNVLEVRAALTAGEPHMRAAASMALDAARIARERGALPYARMLEAQARGYEQGRPFRESIETARHRLTKGAWVRLPPRGSVRWAASAGNSTPEAPNSATDP
jgi:tetratricopeptide (TPR) repeat protein